MNTNIDQAGHTFIREVLKARVTGWNQRRIYVPKYQRPFAWDAKNKDRHVDQLFDDFVEHSKSNVQFSYYLGGLVFVQSVQPMNERIIKKIDILDGQQRLTTLYLFCAALVKNLKKLVDEIDASNLLQTETETKVELKTDINSKIEILKNQLIYENKTILKHAYKDDFEHFNYCVVSYGNNPMRGNLRSTHPIIKAFNVLDEKINEYIQQTSVHITDEIAHFKNSKHQLYMLSDYIAGDCCEITYTTINKGQEFPIFQTLNDRGKQLNIYDLTRNIMIQQEENEPDWNTNTEKIFDEKIRKNTNPNGNFHQKNAENIILNNWNMQNSNKFTASKYMQAFDEFSKQRFTRRAGHQQLNNYSVFLNTLLISSNSFAEIKKPMDIRNLEDTFGNMAEKKDLSNKISLFNISNVKQHYALYFALRNHNHPAKIVTKYITLVEKTYVNLLLLAEQSPATLENIFSNFAYEIYLAEDDINLLYQRHEDKIKTLIVNADINFINKFETKELSNNQSKYLLSRINLELSNNNIVQMETVELEHVLPNKYLRYWSDVVFLDGKKISEIEPDIIESYLKRIGNHTLLVNVTNLQQSNLSFSDKKVAYEEENIKITNSQSNYSVTSYEKWDSESIKDRSNTLATVAENIWGV